MHHIYGFIVHGNESLICKLKKILYDLKQAPIKWYKNFDSLKLGKPLLLC